MIVHNDRLPGQKSKHWKHSDRQTKITLQAKRIPGSVKTVSGSNGAARFEFMNKDDRSCRCEKVTERDG